MDLNERLFGHDRDTTFQLLALCNELTDAEWDQEFDIGHRTLRETFCHMILSVNFWTAAMTDEPVEWKEERLSPQQIRQEHAASYDRFERFARDIISDESLDDTFEDHWKVRHSFGATILHVILHNHVHRSDVLHILQRLGKQDLPEGDPQEWEWRLRQSGDLPTA